MYTSYFGFTEKPFKLKPDARTMFNAASAQRCYADLVREILEQRASIVLSGESGCGKTTLVDKCCAGLADVVRFVRITNVHLSADEILDALAESLGIGARDRNLKRRRRRLRASLAAEVQRGRGVVLVVDDAHALSDEALASLLSFTAEPLDGQRVLQLLLVGLPELVERCRATAPSLAVCNLDGLLASEIDDFVRHQLRIAGYRGEPLFTHDAIRTVATYAGGVPRRINALCDAALFAASLDQRRTVTSQLVADAVEHSFLKDSAPGVPLVMPAPPTEPEEAQPQPASEEANGEAQEDSQRTDLASLAADMEQTLERALAVASNSAEIMGNLAKPLLKRGIRNKPPAADTSATPADPQPSVPRTATDEAKSPQVMDDMLRHRYVDQPSKRFFRRSPILAGVSLFLVAALGVGVWQWQRIKPALPFGAVADKPAVVDEGAKGSEPGLVTASSGNGEKPLDLPRSLEFQPPVAESPSQGLPPVESDTQDGPLQATHQFLEARGVRGRRAGE